MCYTVPDWIKRLRLPGPPANPRSCSEPALLTVRVQTQRLTKASAWGLWALLSLVPSTGRARVPPASTTEGPWWPRALDKVRAPVAAASPAGRSPFSTLLEDPHRDLRWLPGAGSSCGSSLWGVQRSWCSPQGCRNLARTRWAPKELCTIYPKPLNFALWLSPQVAKKNWARRKIEHGSKFPL